ncbi:peptide ABC transporter permease [Pullulanibacillus camelliae]|uniref:Peptide ABC transporter permease n=1 Tax=Pullulanibacillus camelliae TaxID=1707096 RepID=A0A8J2YLM4_9BACL|nr:oligopeptide ABC transporter permease [Pullulanibacillus camelliae]GGE51181.1 peptide ABC transporter permease [Pullulanibacillus camelliae]
MALSNNEITKEMFEPVAMSSSESEAIVGKSTSFWKDSFQRLLRNKGAVISAIILLLIVLMALIGPTMNKYGIDDQDVVRQNLPAKIPGLDKIHWLPFDGVENNVDLYQTQHAKDNFWFGTDDLGRDLWTRTWKGTQVSLFIAVVAAAIDLLIGVAYGGISAYFGGKVDNVLQRIVEVIIGIPNLVIIILMILILQPGLVSIIVAMVITGWVTMSRIVRAQMLKLKSEEYVLASRTLGASHSRIISRHLLPNTLGQIIINTMFTIPSAIFFEAFLSFIGLGIKDPVASLGSLINRGYGVMQIHPYQVIFPGIVISLLLICFNILGDGLRDAFDPKLRQ